jgi:hypothetical protein
VSSLQELLDRQALAELVACYSRAIDRRDFALLHSLYLPEAIHDHGGLFRGGRDAFVAWLSTAMQGGATHHLVGNTLFAIDGDRAEGEVYTINFHVIGRAESRDYIASGRYLDTYRRENGRWRFASRQRLLDWAWEGPSAPAGTGATIARGLPGPDDAATTRLPLLSARLRTLIGQSD